MSSSYSNNVFLNFPFDARYAPMRNAIVFSVFDCGFVPRCALEIENSGEVRFDRIQRLIHESKFGIHDISRTELDSSTGLPRFNMPLELGVFIGAKRFGSTKQKQKNCLILDVEQYRYQAFVSDIAGHDISAHSNEPQRAITIVRNWLNSASGRRTIPGGSEILRRFTLFESELPEMCEAIPIGQDELTYNDYSNFVSEWLAAN
ncbi:MAG: hypothetical protein OYM47_17725 [Gemmatimonadota bacterium]|nr:hypothetical protein [Gemmatimonadota bacterium]